MTLDSAATQHSARTREYIARQIAAAGGWIAFERFMDLALYAPGYGYYSAGAQKLGADGDFTTAPEVSALFGACVARQCAEILRELPGGCIVEIGAGSGRMAVDILSRLETLDSLPAHYSILEVSAELRDRQRTLIAKRLPHIAARVRWLDHPLDTSFDGIVLANEVLDALPVARFRWLQSGVEELGVAQHAGQFLWEAHPASGAMARACDELQRAAGWDEGYVSEYCPRLVAWAHAVTHSLRKGAALWFDYGLPRTQYYLPERHEGTLVCHYRHRIGTDPFAHVGLQDITAWVDFTRVAEASRESGFELAGFTTQAHFLAAIGIDQEMHLAAAEDANLFARFANQARQLMLPGEMGERFKVMAWLRGIDMPLSGFGLRDLRHTL
jgi:SAM-dependent MidA family methyltransferase